MGVKRTVFISRRDAEEKCADLIIAANRRKFLAKYIAMSNRELERELEHLNDAAHDGEGFENYLIDTDVLG